MLKTIAATTALATFFVGYGVLDRTAPALTSSADQLLRDHLLGWSSAEACQRHPTACLAHQGKELAAKADEIDATRDDLGPALVRNEMLQAEHRQKLAQNALLLEDGRKRLALAGDTAGGGIEFAGAIYPDRTALEAQLQLLWQERQSMQVKLEDIESLQRELQERERELQIKRQEVGVELEMMPARQQAVAVRHLLQGFAETTSRIATLLDETREGLGRAEPLIATTVELQARAGRAPTVETPDAAFRQFLSGGLDAAASPRSRPTQPEARTPDARGRG